MSRNIYDIRYEAWRRGYNPDEVEQWYEYDRDPYEVAMDRWRDTEEILDEYAKEKGWR